MSILEKVSHLGAAGKYDVCASTASPRKTIKSEKDRVGDAAATGICHSFTEDGRCVALFKTLYTNACKFDCKYCINSTSCKEKKQIYKYEPEELAKTFMHLYIRNYVEGLFLSSGIASDQNVLIF
jgi:predicted DNA-binding helix-hairpin-helix protein